MARIRPNPRLVKIHRNYTLEEVSRLFGMHRNSVRQWVKRGLPLIDDRRPALIHGAALASFLMARRRSRRSPCGPGQFFCLRCRSPRDAGGRMAEFVSLTETTGNLRAICEQCGVLMPRRVRSDQLETIAAGLDLIRPGDGGRT